MNFRARVASLRGRVLDGHGTAYVSSTIARPILEHPTGCFRESVLLWRDLKRRSRVWESGRGRFLGPS